MNNDDKKLLQEAYDSDIFDSREVSEQLNIMKREKVKKVHTFKITHLEGKEERWQTYILVDGERKKVSATSERILINKLYEHYFSTDKVTLKSLYPEWLEKRANENVKSLTIRRNMNHWDKYYASNEIVNISLSRLTSERIENFLYQVIRDYDITVKELNNMKFIIKDILAMAKRRKLIYDNPFDDVEVKTISCRNVDKHSAKERVYLPDEMKKLYSEIKTELHKCPDSTLAYGIMLIFKTGVRIGELVAIRWSDIDFESGTIHIRRMETRNVAKDGKIRKEVVERTKKNSPYGNRFIPFGEDVKELLNRIKRINEEYGYKESDFVFCNQSGRVGIRAVDNRIRKLCNRAGIPEKSAHDIRRTYASTLFNNDVPVEVIRQMMGHSDIQTTFGYIYNVNGEEQTKRMVVNALSGMNSTLLDDAI